MADLDETPSGNATTMSKQTKGFGRGFGRGVLQEINSENNNYNTSKPGGLSNGFGKSRNESGFGSKPTSNGFGNADENSGFQKSGGFGGNFGGGSKGFGSTNGRSGGGSGCFKCGEEGHMSRECPSAGGQSRGKGCFKCGEEGHMSRECPSAGGQSRGKGCFKCGEEGHMSRECPSAAGDGGRSSGGFGGGGGRSSGGFGGGDGGTKSGGFGDGGGFGGAAKSGGNSSGFGGGGHKNSGCFKCGEEGHMSRECPNAETKDGEKREIYVPPEPSNDEAEMFKSIEKGINFDKYDSIPVEVSGRSPVSFISNFDEAGLRDTFLRNVRKANYDKPTPVQKYAIPIIMAGRDLMACAQTGSGKTAAFVLPVITCMMKEGLQSSQFSEIQTPQAITVAPTRELADQIWKDARKFAHGTDLRAVVLYGGTSVGHQFRQVEQGAHFVVGTPGRLLDTINKGKISLAKCKFLILDEADRMLDMGFEPDIRKLVETMGMPSKTERQTLMFSATFPEEIQKLAADFLNDYLFVTVGRVGGANTDVEQLFFEIDRLEKREKLCSILNDAGTDKTLVFVEQKRNADFLASYLSQSGFPTTSIHGDRLQREREEALLDFKTGKAPILVATNVAARGLDIPGVKHVVNYDLPQSIDEYVHRIGRTGRCGNIGRATSFYSHDSDSALAKSLVRILYEASQGVPSWLESYAASAMESTGGRIGGRFGGKDIRRNESGGGRGGDSNEWFDGNNAGSNATGGGGDEEEWD
ncbi:probable ATP-dependent RNA helicase vasa-like [Patella vulgata]|uniref:probable ATP-dependent RNA helicase vasa-like n=1 Tax=Patella vulgata TaxID=6465 RepID=UPI00218039A9|nr:probable ATP-dependent RNA helicase vasa-like [Patella vulgata]